MIRITKMADYAIAICALMGRHRETLFTPKSIHLKLGFGEQTIAKILKLLLRAKILSSERGKMGGYKMALSVEAVSILQIIEAVEGKYQLVECGNLTAEQCKFFEQCLIADPLKRLSLKIAAELEAVKLSSLVQGVVQTEKRALNNKMSSMESNQLHEGDK